MSTNDDEPISAEVVPTGGDPDGIADLLGGATGGGFDLGSMMVMAAYMQQQATVASIIYTEIFTRGTEGMLDNAAGLRSIVSTLQYREQQLEEAYAAAIGRYTASMP